MGYQKKTVLWCQRNDTFVKIIDFVTIFGTQRMSLGQHQSITYETSHKMTPSEVMLWCRPNDKFVENVVFGKS